MPQITLTLSTEHQTRLLEAFSQGYQSSVTNEDGATTPNPQTKAQFARKQLFEYLANFVRNHEASILKQEAVKNLNSLIIE